MLFTIFDYYYVLFIVTMFLYGDKCVNYRALKETIAKTCKHIPKTQDLGNCVEKNADNGATCCLDSFSGRPGYLNFPSLGSPHGGGKWKKHPLEGSICHEPCIDVHWSFVYQLSDSLGNHRHNEVLRPVPVTAWFGAGRGLF